MPSPLRLFQPSVFWGRAKGGGVRAAGGRAFWGMLWLLFTPAHVALFAVATSVISGRWRAIILQLLHLQYLPLGILAGCGLFGVSLVAVRGRVGNLADFLPIAYRNLRLNLPPLTRLLVLGGRAIYEEALWRGTAQAVLGNGWFAIGAVSLLFTLQHIYLSRINSRPVHPRAAAELFLFSVAVGLMYIASAQLLLVVGVHWIRNILIGLCSSPQSPRFAEHSPSLA